jgi:glycosyltransferase involved in cell wall biosynthesis
MIQPPAITVFMAVYNGSRYLKEAIGSVLAQTFSNFELLIINDGSNDNSVEIIQSYTDPRIRLLHNDINRGLVFTRQRGVSEARGEYLAILDCDDIALPERLQIQYDFFQHNPNIALCSGRARYIDANGETTGESPLVRGDKNVLLIFGNFLINSAVMVKIEAVKSVGSYHANAPAEDYDLAMRLSACFPIEIIDDILVKYRIHEQNISMQDFSHQTRVEKNIFRDFHQRFGLKTNERVVDLHHTLLSHKTQAFSLNEYYSFFVDLISNDQLRRAYNLEPLREALFHRWYELVMKKGDEKSLALLFSPKIFNSKYLTFKQLRRAFKKSLKEFFKE